LNLWSLEALGLSLVDRPGFDTLPLRFFSYH